MYLLGMEFRLGLASCVVTGLCACNEEGIEMNEIILHTSTCLFA